MSAIEMSSYCRLCMEETENFELIDDGNTITNRQKIEIFLPEIAIDVVDICVLCLNCAKIFRDIYEFKLKSLENEETITNYIKNNGISGQVSLKNVVDSLYQNKYENFEIVQCGDDDSKDVDEDEVIIPDDDSTDPILVEIKNESNDLISEIDIKPCEINVLKMDEKTSYKCHTCNEIFSRLSTFQKHMKSHAKCLTCGMTFKFQYQYEKHVLLHKTKCEKCLKVFAGQYELKTHLEDTHGCKYELGRYKCTPCKVIFYTQSALSKHEATHLSENKGMTENCNDEFDSACHTDRPPENRKHDCKICGKVFSKYSHLTTHLVRLHGCTKNHKCEHCESAFDTKDDLVKHAELHSKTEKGYVCNVCGKAFSTSRQLKNHRQLHVKGECSYCHLTMRKSSLRYHVRTHTGERPFKCEKCGKGFAQSGSLNTHLRHTHNASKRFVCDVCQAKFKYAVSLRLHMEKHGDRLDKPHVCEVCGKAFCVAYALKNHKLRHTNERNHMCFVCGKSFVDLSGLRRHTKIHTGEKPYQCKMCEYRSNRPENLRVHMKSHLKKTKTGRSRETKANKQI